MPPLVRRYVKTSFVFLISWLVLGGYIVVAQFVVGVYPPRPFITAHVHLLLVGFMLMIVSALPPGCSRAQRGTISATARRWRKPSVRAYAHAVPHPHTIPPSAPHFTAPQAFEPQPASSSCSAEAGSSPPSGRSPTGATARPPPTGSVLL
jgi:hypothetical protein